MTIELGILSTHQSWNEDVALEQFDPDSLVAHELAQTIRPIRLDKKYDQLIQVETEDEGENELRRRFLRVTQHT